MATVSAPVVLLALSDDPVAHAFTAAALAQAPDIDARPCRTREELFETFATENVTLVVLSSRIDNNGGASTLRELGAFGPIPETVVLFHDADDRRRTLVAQAGATDFVLPSSKDLSALLSLIHRKLTRRAIEARLDLANRQFRMLVDASTDGIYIIRDGRFVYANRRFQELVGYSLDELTRDGFKINDLVAPESVPIIEERNRRVNAGEPVEPRYQFTGLKKGGERFDVQVSISYIDISPTTTGMWSGGALGIMQDITEQKRQERKLVRKNRELALLNELQASINQAAALDEILARGCEQLGQLVGAAASGIMLLSSDERSLQLRFSADLDEAVKKALADVPLDEPSLVATAVRSGELLIIDDFANDDRVAIDAVRSPTFRQRFSGCIVVPLGASSTPSTSNAKLRRLGAAFVCFPRGRPPSSDDREVMASIGPVLGNAVEKAQLLEAERAAVEKLTALDEIAVALASTLDVNEVSLIVGRSVHRLFGATRVLIAQLDDERRFFVPLHVLDDGEPITAPPIPVGDSIMGLCLSEKTAVQRIRPDDGAQSIDPLTSRPVQLLPYEHALFDQGIGAGVAVPIMQDGQPAGALWLGYSEAEPLSPQELGVLSSIGTHVAIAMKNASLFAARNRALDELQQAQDKLVESEKLNAIGLIAHGVAHDFNNVLGSILGRAQLLKSQLRDPALKKHADVIERAAIDGAETVRRIQEIGRQDKIDDFVPVDLDTIVHDVAELTQPKWKDAPERESGRIELVVDSTGPQRAVVAANPHQLREVLVNLVHNAVDAMPQGGVITLGVRERLPPAPPPPMTPSGLPRPADELIEAHADDDGNGACQLVVTDTGTGMPQEILHRIFDPYFTTKGARGTGLGLSVSQSIVRRHGGDLDVTSRQEGPDRGTTFTITLPRWHMAGAESARALDELDDEHAPAAPTAGRRHARVLVVDDEENIREILAEILMNGEHEVVTAADGPEALRHLREHDDFDLVFTDLGLPGMNGYEVASEIKKLRPELPVGLVTGWGATLDADKARAHGVDLVISKPFRFEQVLSLVDEALLAKRGRSDPRSA